METIDTIRARTPNRFAEALAKIRAAGTDNLSFFGGGYEKEGGYSLQQNTEEFAALVCYLDEKARDNAFYLEIGTASGGVCRLLNEELAFGDVVVIDDHGHHRWTEQAEHLGAVRRSLGPERYAEHIGDSHAEAARTFLEDQCGQPGGADSMEGGRSDAVDVAFIDGDHTYDGVSQDIRLVRPHMRMGGLVILHDIVACDGVKRAWQELASWCDPMAEFVGPGRPLGIGVGRVR